MALSAHERQVLLLTLHVEVPEGAPSWSAGTYFQLIKDIYDADQGGAVVLEGLHVESEGADEEGDQELPGRVPSPIDGVVPAPGPAAKPDGLIRIADLITGDDGTMTILIHHGDAKAPDPAFIHLPTGEVRSSGMGEEDGLAHAAHLVINLAPGAAKTISANAVLERAPNLGRVVVIDFLNMLVRRTCQHNKITYVDQETGNRLRYNPKLSATQPLSASVKGDISGNKINRIELVRLRPPSGLDEQGVIRPETLTLVHKVDPSYPKSKNLELVERVRKLGVAGGYQDMHVRLNNSDSKRTMSPRFAMDHADATDTVYARVETIQGFSHKLLQCPEKVVPELLTKMHAMFNVRRYWKS